ncbi:hypothetical protein ES705_23607 [subsurface metagenome]
MANNDFDEKRLLKATANAQEYLEEALECDNEGLRKKIELVSEVLDKFQEISGKRIYRKVVKKSGLSLEMFNAMLLPISNMYKNALDFDDNKLRKFIELYIESGKEARASFFGAEK